MNFDHKILKLSCGSVINIYQNVFPRVTMDFFHQFACASKYSYGRSSDFASRRNKLGSFFSCELTKEDDANFHFNENEIVIKITGKRTRTKSWINATETGSQYFPHADGHCLTLLYYINPIWNTDYGGETFFYDFHKNEKEIAVDFVPGQIVTFNGVLTHKPGLVLGNPEPRYVYTCQYTLE